jgi:hypothetical protein
MNWVLENWYLWNGFVGGGLILGLYLYLRRRNPGVIAIARKMLFGFAAFMMVVATAAMLLMAIGTFTVEWTCQCDVPNDWSCKGATCDSEADLHFNATKHTVTCTRTDWPMRALDAVGRLLLPE